MKLSLVLVVLFSLVSGSIPARAEESLVTKAEFAARISMYQTLKFNTDRLMTDLSTAPDDNGLLAVHLTEDAVVAWVGAKVATKLPSPIYYKGQEMTGIYKLGDKFVMNPNPVSVYARTTGKTLMQVARFVKFAGETANAAAIVAFIGEAAVSGYYLVINTSDRDGFMAHLASVSSNYDAEIARLQKAEQIASLK